MSADHVGFRVAFDGDTAVLHLYGEFDVTNEAVLRDVASSVVAAHVLHVRVDASHVTSAALSLLDVLLGLALELDVRGGHMTVVTPSRHVHRLLALTDHLGLIEPDDSGLELRPDDNPLAT
jgi:anti-anti-sigma factor